VSLHGERRLEVKNIEKCDIVKGFWYTLKNFDPNSILYQTQKNYYHCKGEVKAKEKKIPKSITFTHSLVLFFLPTYKLYSFLHNLLIQGFLFLIPLFHKPHRVHIPTTKVGPYPNLLTNPS
jgi:hypothetical protein